MGQYKHLTDKSNVFLLPTGNISKNCTEDGWSEVFPQITRVCGAEEKHDKVTRVMFSESSRSLVSLVF